MEVDRLLIQKKQEALVLVPQRLQGLFQLYLCNNTMKVWKQISFICRKNNLNKA